MGKYSSYPKYKTLDVEWLDCIPEHWSNVSLKMMIDVRDGTHDTPAYVEPSDESYPLVTSKDVTGGYIDLSDCKQISRMDYELIVKRSGVAKGDILMPMIGTVGSPILLEQEVEIAIKNLALFRTSVGDNKLCRKYLFYFLNSSECSVQFSLESRGGVQNFVSLGTLRNLGLPLVPRNEQTQIANFLDHETAKIDTLIEKQQQLIKLLKEKRQAVISHAVTKGLNPQVPMKDSGVEWFDAVPMHWKIMELKFSAADGYKTFTDGDWIESPYITDSGVRLLQTGNVGIGEFKEKGFRYISESSFKKLNCTEVKPNDVLICRLDGPVGRSCLAPDLGVKVITSVDNAILKTHRDFDARFIVYLTNSTPWLRWIQDLCRVGGGFRLRISRTMLGEQRIPVPPLDEQISIANMLDELSDKHLRCIEQAEKSIVLLRERRTSLISAVVTGKIDVRNWQAPTSQVQALEQTA
ncbi:hypothetical protein J7H93_004340 [Vibrio parahaemolyticus]|uniref:restriction endonuclease subunit S n=1 Tax=Vibrio parahaemolyticus TaxID=670 RepID=UPI00084AF011|nr:restriction endonuclease subunit S [Vibrio parahaemolyticus]EGQ8260420.1 hypothetical protein [Vibrio parahaemolyticus]EGQ8842501.1 hypothetical protein [Vibrio parahaemolyticus]EGQ9512183.1 hypothetical protein [Vibrio parahaemolyticus]EHH1106271.1 hypothetical protein [Vibrio parahaemolyticus]EHH1933470.1 hypothetical protein [Vibrio parahaemolyticus]